MPTIFNTFRILNSTSDLYNLVGEFTEIGTTQQYVRMKSQKDGHEEHLKKETYRRYFAATL